MLKSEYLIVGKEEVENQFNDDGEDIKGEAKVKYLYVMLTKNE